MLYDFYRIHAPESGEWTMRILGIELPEPEHYAVSVFGQSGLKMKTSFDRDEYKVGQPIIIEAEITENDAPVTDATVTAEIQAPATSYLARMTVAKQSGMFDDTKKSKVRQMPVLSTNTLTSTTSTFPLYDNGTNGDRMANDGIYTNSYDDTYIDGSYAFEIFASGVTSDGLDFRREDILTTYIAAPDAPKTISVTQPNGGENWATGSAQTVTWDRDNNMGRVRIDLSTDGGASWWDVTDGAYTENDGEFLYIPKPGDVSESCLIQVVSVENPNVYDKSDTEFSITGGAKDNEYFAYRLSNNFPAPIIDGVLDESIWSAIHADTLRFGGQPGEWSLPWLSWQDNLVIWKTLWSQEENKLYVAVTIQDDVQGDFDHNPSSDSFLPFHDESLELFIDADHSGGTYSGHFDQAQHWWLTGENVPVLDNYPTASEYTIYDGDEFTSAVTSGSIGNWICEAALNVYDVFPTERKTLAQGDTVGWNVWYNDSDNENSQNQAFIRDHQVGWIYNGPADENADYFGDLILAGDARLPHLTLVAPSGGELWHIGTSHSIEWLSNGTSGFVNIEISRDNGVTWTTLFEHIPNTHEKYWTVTDPVSEACRIRIIDSEGNVVNQSNSFAIGTDPEWFVDITIQGREKALHRILGGDSTATGEFDAIFDIATDPASLAYNAYFRAETEPSALSTDVRHWHAAAPVNLTWTLEIVNASGIQTTLSWEVFHLPPLGDVELIGSDFKIDMRTQNSVSVKGNATLEIQCRMAQNVTFHFMKSGWYLVSLPLRPENADLEYLFPEATVAYSYAPDQGYESEATLAPGVGYWIHMAAPATHIIYGSPVLSYTTSCQAGWHLIGSVFGSADFTHPNDDPDGSVLSAFGYDANNGSYIEIYPQGTGILEEKNGYWIGVANECQLTVGGENVTSLAKVSAVKRENFITHFGAQPPVPPFEDPSYVSSVVDKFAVCNYPNPFNPETVISYSLPESGFTELYIYNVLGQKIRSLVFAEQDVGVYRVTWNGRNDANDQVAAGVYYYRIKTPKFVETKKMILLR